MTGNKGARIKQLLRTLFRTFLMAWAIALVFIGIFGRDESWKMIAGPADMGAVDFKNVARSSWPNNFLLCPPDYCAPGLPDQIPPVFPVPATRLAELFHEAAMADARVTQVYTNNLDRARYVQRSERLHFPDTISALFIPVDEANSTLAVYSRSQIGYSDRGVNENRVYRWLEALSAKTAN